MNMVDIFIIIIIALTVFLGYRKNLFRNFFDFFALLGGFFVSFHYFGTVAMRLETIPGIKQVLNLIREGLLSKLIGLDEEMKFTLEGLKEINVGDTFNFFFERGSFFRTKDTIVFSELSLGLITNILAIILLFLITVFVIRFIGSFIENANKMAGLTLVDRLGGIVFSFLKSLIYAAIIAVIVSNISSFFNSGLLYDLFHKSKIAQFFYESGLIATLLK